MTQIQQSILDNYPRKSKEKFVNGKEQIEAMECYEYNLCNYIAHLTKVNEFKRNELKRELIKVTTFLANNR